MKIHTWNDTTIHILKQSCASGASTTHSNLLFFLYRCVPSFFSNKIWAIFCSSSLSNIIEVKFLMFMKVHHFVFHFLIGFILFFMFRSILSYNIIVSDGWFTATREDVCRFEVLCIVMGEYNFVGFDHHDAICVNNP